MTTQPTTPADPWDEFQAMTSDEQAWALAYVAGSDPDVFARVMEVSRPERVARRASGRPDAHGRERVRDDRSHDRPQLAQVGPLSAAELRQAAATLRERAKAATPGPWTNRRGPAEMVMSHEGSTVANETAALRANALSRIRHAEHRGERPSVWLRDIPLLCDEIDRLRARNAPSVTDSRFPLFLHYEPTPPTEEEAEPAAMWERVKREGCVIVDAAGNVIGHVEPGGGEEQPDGTLTFTVRGSLTSE